MAKSDSVITTELKMAPTSGRTQSSRIPIKVAHLHQPAMVPALANSTENHLGKPGHSGFTMELGPEGLWVIGSNGRTSIIPSANIKSMEIK